MTEKKPTGLRLNEQTLATLKEIAKREHRSLNNLLEVIIDEYLKTKEGE